MTFEVAVKCKEWRCEEVYFTWGDGQQADGGGRQGQFWVRQKIVCIKSNLILWNVSIFAFLGNEKAFLYIVILLKLLRAAKSFISNQSLPFFTLWFLVSSIFQNFGKIVWQLTVRHQVAGASMDALDARCPTLGCRGVHRCHGRPLSDTRLQGRP